MNGSTERFFKIIYFVLNLHERVRVSLGALFIWSYSTSKQKPSKLLNILWRKQQAENKHVCKNEKIILKI